MVCGSFVYTHIDLSIVGLHQASSRLHSCFINASSRSPATPLARSWRHLKWLLLGHPVLVSRACLARLQRWLICEQGKSSLLGWYISGRASSTPTVGGEHITKDSAWFVISHVVATVELRHRSQVFDGKAHRLVVSSSLACFSCRHRTRSLAVAVGACWIQSVREEQPERCL